MLLFARVIRADMSEYLLPLDADDFEEASKEVKDRLKHALMVTDNDRRIERVKILSLVGNVDLI